MHALLSALERRGNWIAVAVALVVIAGGFVYARALGDRIRYPDEQDYTAIADNLVAGRGFSIDGETPTAYRAPTYPFCLSVISRLGGGMEAWRRFGFVALGLTVVLVSATVRRAVSPLAGAFAALLAPAYPVLFYTAGTFYPQTLAACLFAAVLYLLFGLRRDGLLHAASVGVVFGLLILTVPTFIFALGVTVLWLAVRRRTWRGVAHAAVIGGVAGAVLLAWVARNSVAFGRPVSVSTNLGIAFYTGNAPDAGANTGVNIDYEPHADALEGLSEPEQSAYYLHAAFEAIKADPGRAVWLYGAKFLNHFNYRNQLCTAAESTRARELLMLVSYGLLVGLAGARLGLARRRPLTPFERYSLMLYVLNGAFAALFLTRIRLRLPFDWLLIGVAGSLCAMALRAIADRDAAAGTAKGSPDS